MTTSPKTVSDCAIERSLGVLGERWSFLILREAFFGATRFADFRANLGVASDVLTDRLATLVGAGVLERRPYQDPGSRVRESYHLTQAGKDLVVVLGALQQWGDAHLPRANGPSVVRCTEDGRSASVAFVDGSGQVIDPSDVRFRPAPSARRSRSASRTSQTRATPPSA